jgi:hypothetical protein
MTNASTLVADVYGSRGTIAFQNVVIEPAHALWAVECDLCGAVLPPVFWPCRWPIVALSALHFPGRGSRPRGVHAFGLRLVELGSSLRASACHLLVFLGGFGCDPRGAQSARVLAPPACFRVPRSAVSSTALPGSEGFGFSRSSASPVNVASSDVTLGVRDPPHGFLPLRSRLTAFLSSDSASAAFMEGMAPFLVLFVSSEALPVGLVWARPVEQMTAVAAMAKRRAGILTLRQLRDRYRWVVSRMPASTYLAGNPQPLNPPRKDLVNSTQKPSDTRN